MLTCGIVIRVKIIIKVKLQFMKYDTHTLLRWRFTIFISMRH